MKKVMVLPLLLFFVLLSALPLTAQVIDRSGKPHPEVDYERLQRIDALVNDYVKKDWVKGVVTLIIKDNQVVQHKGYGHLDLKEKKGMPNDAIFRIMSQTKAITSIGIMILYEQGRLLLDQPVADFIPEFKNPVVLDTYNATDTTYTTVPAKRDITIRDLLTHTSGIDYADIGSEKMRAIYAKHRIPSGLGYFDANLLAEMKKLAKLPLVSQPGEKFVYGLNTDLLGCLIEVISGESLEVFLTKNLFEPLGMTDTYFNVPKKKEDRLAAVYTEDANGKVIAWGKTFRNIDPEYPLMKKSFFSGGAGLSSTAFDYAVFLQMLLNGGVYNGKRILSPRTVELITSNQLDFHFNGVNDFGLGFGITTEKSAGRNARNTGSFAWGGYYGTTYWVDPKEKMVCLIMSQHTPNSHGDLFSRIENIMYSSLK